jgi:UDP-glucose-4-epimerase GalE
MILVTGGAGYIGAHTAKQLAMTGYHPVILDNLSRGHREFVRWGPFVEGDVGDRELLRKLFATHRISAVLHFAGFAYVDESVRDPAPYYRNNVANTLTLLEAMQQAAVRRIVFSSTCATYGIPDVLPIPESHPQRPISPYGRSKLMAETILKDFCRIYGMRCVALRYFNAAGADPEGDIGEWHEPETHLIPLALEAAARRNGPLRILGGDYDTPDGTCIRDYIHVSDLAAAHVAALEYLEADGDSIALNLGNGRGFSVREVVAAAARITGKDIPIEEAPRREGDPMVLLGSSEQARRVLGWRPRHIAIGDIISTAWAWYGKLNTAQGGR